MYSIPLQQFYLYKFISQTRLLCCSLVLLNTKMISVNVSATSQSFYQDFTWNKNNQNLQNIKMVLSKVESQPRLVCMV